MPAPQLDNLVATGALKAEPPDPRELAGLIGAGAAKLTDARNPTLSLESRFDLAYNAAHAFALAALRAHGYRPDNRYIVFQSLQHTVQLPPAQWRVLDRAHSERNRSVYEGVFEVDRALVEAVLIIAGEVETRVRALRNPRKP